MLSNNFQLNIFVINTLTMAKVQFLLQSESTTAPIYLRFSLGRALDIKRKTGFICDAKNWSAKTGFPKIGDANNKNLKTTLQKLEVFVLDEYNKDFTQGKIIDADWLVKKIDFFNGRIEHDEKHYLVNYGEYYLEQLPYGVSPKGIKGVSDSSIKKMRTIVNKIIQFQDYKKKKYLLKEVDLEFSRDFIRFLIESGTTNDNTAGRYIKFVKTIILDARKNGYEVSHQVDSIKGFTIPPPKNPFSFEEINIIKNTEFVNEKLEITRDWFVIGCYVGQRASDLFRMNKNMIEVYNGLQFITLIQKKTGKTVQIPIHKEVQNVLDKRNGDFPPLFSNNIETQTTFFNRYIKKVCQQAGLINLVEGNLFDKDKKRTVKGKFPKWQLASSHDCRRSFASNFYSKREFPTPILMNITAHSSEKQFLEYIGKKPLDYSLQLAEIWKEQEEEGENIKLTTLKRVK